MQVVNSELREIAMKSGNGETRVRGVERFFFSVRASVFSGKVETFVFIQQNFYVYI